MPQLSNEVLHSLLLSRCWSGQPFSNVIRGDQDERASKEKYHHEERECANHSRKGNSASTSWKGHNTGVSLEVLIGVAILEPLKKGHP